MRLTVSIASAIFAITLSASAGQGNTIEGLVERGRADELLIRDGVRSYRLDPPPAGFEALINRPVSVDGDVGEVAEVGVRTLTITQINMPQAMRAQGIVMAGMGAPRLALEDGDLRLDGAPEDLLAELEGRRIDASGWRYDDDSPYFVLTSVAGKVIEDGYLSVANPDAAPDAPPREKFQFVSQVHVGEPVRVVGLRAYDQATATMKPILDADDDDLTFAIVQTGRPGERFTGWLPLYKLEVGEAVDAEQDGPVAPTPPPAEQAELEVDDEQPEVPASVVEDGQAEQAAPTSGLDDQLASITKGTEGEEQDLPAEQTAPAEVTPAEVTPAEQAEVTPAEVTPAEQAEVTPAEQAPAIQDEPLYQPELEQQPLPEPTRAVVSTEANLRSQPTRSSVSQAVVLETSELEVLAVEGAWTLVSTPGPIEGYVDRRYLRPISQPAADGSRRAVVIDTSHVNLRAEPRPGKDVASVYYLPEGTEVRVTGNTRGWIHVQNLEPTVGYVATYALDIEEPAPQQAGR